MKKYFKRINSLKISFTSSNVGDFLKRRLLLRYGRLKFTVNGSTIRHTVRMMQMMVTDGFGQLRDVVRTLIHVGTALFDVVDDRLANFIVRIYA